MFQEKVISKLWETKNLVHYPFGGLHVHAVIAAKLLCQEDPELIGNSLDSKKVKIYTPKKGEVVHIDNFGLSKIWLKNNDFMFEEDTPILIKIYTQNGSLKKEIKGIYSNRMMNYEDNKVVAYPGGSLLDPNFKNDIEKYRTSGLIEVGLVRNPQSSKFLNIELGDIIKIIKDK